MSAFRRWQLRHVVWTCIGYWIVLILAKAGPALWEFLRIQLTHGHGSVSVSFSGSLLSLALWIAGPPLLLLLLWIATRPRAGERAAVP